MRSVASCFVLVLAVLALGCGGAPRSSGWARTPRATLPVPTWPEPPPDPWSLAAIGYARAQVGKRYCWGGTGPDCFDCSGLVQAAWRWGGARLPRTTGEQGRTLATVPLADLRPGDILWWSHGHVALYVGAGIVVDAYHSGAGVVERRAPVPERVLRAVPQPVQGYAARAPAPPWSR